ncbi:hypothetical protein [Ruegeria sp. HU-ET01832]|uniref:hypothetical protein n=1 Tax=Ruegeria sp. HU-ET01832 TaxID=3135906 RepID=UPI0033416CA5
MAQLDTDTRSKLDWRATEYVGTFDVQAPIRLGWQAWGLLTQRQNLVLQRVLLHGLPNLSAIPDETVKSARAYRRFSIFLYALFSVLVFLPALIGLSEDLAELTGSSTGFWRIILVLFLGVWVFLPSEEFKKWPEIEGIQ